MRRSAITPEQARKRMIGDEWLAQVRERLRRIEDLIEQSSVRIAEHATVMERMDRDSPRLYAISRDLHRNLEEGLKMLVHHQAIMWRELQYIERCRAVEAGRNYQS